MAVFGYRQDINLDGVNPKLADIMKLAAASYDNPAISKVELISGKREGDSRQHGKGNAIDIQLYDKDGKAIPDYQDSKHFGVYQGFANHVKDVQSQVHPELSNDLRWGGYFSGPIGKGGKYGAMDLMHFDLAGSKIGMAAGSWTTGLHDQWKKAWGINGNQAAGNSVTGGGSADASGQSDLTGNSVLSRASGLLDQQGWSAPAKAAILASMSRESGFDTSATNNNGERSYGLFQWNGPRQDAMRAFTQDYAKQNGVSPNSPDAQLAFFQHEMNTTESSAGDALRNASDPEAANAAMRQFERYGGGDAEEAARLATTQKFLAGDYSGIRASRGAVAGTPTDSTLDPSAMQSAFNAAGVTDHNGSPLAVDGIIGARTMSARDKILDTARSLSPSSKPQDITAVQAALNSLGVRGQDGNAIAVDGQYGPQTAYAVTQIQPKFSAPISPRAYDTGDPASRGTISWVAKDKNASTPLTGLANDVKAGIGDVRSGLKDARDGFHNLLVGPDGKPRLLSGFESGLKNLFNPADSTSTGAAKPAPGLDTTLPASAPTPSDAIVRQPVAPVTPAGDVMPSTAAMAAMNLTPQEQNLYQHHLDVLDKGQGVQNPDGSTSTIYQTSVDIDGKTYNFPTVWDGKILPPHEAVERSLADKPLDAWPSYPTVDAAESRYAQMHTGLEKDITPSAAPIPTANPMSRLTSALFGNVPDNVGTGVASPTDFPGKAADDTVASAPLFPGKAADDLASPQPAPQVLSSFLARPQVVGSNNGPTNLYDALLGKNRDDFVATTPSSFPGGIIHDFTQEDADTAKKQKIMDAMQAKTLREDASNSNVIPAAHWNLLRALFG